jgi:hypothetical protein
MEAYKKLAGMSDFRDYLIDSVSPYFRCTKVYFSVIIWMLFVSCNANSEVSPGKDIEKDTQHPFLIVQKDQFPMLRNRASSEPWKSMIEDAIHRSKNGSSAQPYDLQYYIGAAALSYILDEENAQTHANRVRDAILDQYSLLDLQDGSSWSGVVPPMGSFFVAILALDIVYDALSIEEIQACEEVILNQIFKIDRSGPWADVRLGTHGTWDIYKGNRTAPDDDYYEGVMRQVTEDGVSPVTNHYAWERVGGGNSRVSKSGYMDVLEFTRIDQRYYNNERLQKFHRWLFGSSINCSKEMAIFGDMLPTQEISNDMLHRRVINFDLEAAGYAAWFHEGTPAIGHILTYILPKEALPAPVVPSSKIFPNGGAFFREGIDNSDGLHAVLYNIMSQDEWHTHNEVNGLALSGYGNRLLVNGGRLGEPTRAANLNNTLTINGENHDARIGGGILEGFAAIDFDYSSGISGPALINSQHSRNMVLIHGSDLANAYFVIFDEIEANVGDQVKNYLHPANQTTVAAIATGMEYQATIDHYPTVTGTKLSIFYGTPPSTVNIEKVPSAVPDRYPGYPDHNRLESIYETDITGKLNLVTIIFPHDFSHQKPSMTRVTGEDYSGGRIDHSGSLTDIILETSGEKAYVHQEITFKGKALIVRELNHENTFYFIRKGTELDHNGVGFTSDTPVSIYSKNNNGAIVSEGAKVILNGSSMHTMKFDPPVEILNSDDNFVEIQLPEGTVQFFQ